MKKFIVLLLFTLLNANTLYADKKQLVTVRHIPTTVQRFNQGPFPHMWYFRTEVKNNSKKELRVVWFEAYVQFKGRWLASNVLGRTLRGKDFSSWYTEGAKTRQGIIKPGDTAVCDFNWYGSVNEKDLKRKWSYILVDKQGNDYFVEQIVDPKVVKHVSYKSSKLPKTTNQK